MKKYSSIFICSFIAISFSFYSCASDSKDAEEIIEAPAPELPIDDLKQNELILNINNSETNNEFSDSPDIAEEELLSDNTNENEESYAFEFPDELDEPDVFEEELTEVVENSELLNENDLNINKDEIESETEELITLDELDDIANDDITNNDDFINIEISDSIPEYDLESNAEENAISDIINSIESAETNSSEILVETDDSNITTESDTVFEETNSEINPLDDEYLSNNDNSEDVSYEEEVNIVEEIIPSRKVTLKRGEYLDVIYPGNGWIYMGVTDGSKDITYNGRKLGTADTTFTLIAKVPGIKIVHFYKTDNITGNYIDDYLEIEVLNERTNSKIHQIAPSYADIVPLKPQNDTNDFSSHQIENGISNYIKANDDSDIIDLTDSPSSTDDDIIFLDSDTSKASDARKKSDNNINSFSENENTVTKNIIDATSESALIDSEKKENQNVSNIDPEVLFIEANNAFNEKNYENALKMIEDYINLSTKNLDEAYYLKGQIFEAQSGIQNINNAVEEYNKILKLYPTSKYWDKANKRIIYLKRFYLEVR